MVPLINATLAVVYVVGGLILLYAGLNVITNRLPQRIRRWAQPLAFISPALLLIAVVIVYPVIDTIRISFMNDNSTAYVGLDNYKDVFVDPATIEALRNNVAWLIIVPIAVVIVAVLIAWMADRLKQRSEVAVKTIIFLPMAVSFVGASTVWGFVYQYRPAGQPQTGLLNAIWTGFGGQPQAWLTSFPVNNAALMIVVLWLQCGMATVLLSAAIKAVPVETLEAARVDGASEGQIFRRIILPQIKASIAMVFSTLIIFILKIFDIVYVMTNGNFGTEVIADLFIKKIFTYNQFGRAAAIVVVLLICTTPIIVLNVRRFRKSEGLS